MERSIARASRALSGACDACRRRKVKCDAANPCANCTISRIPCEHRTLPRKRGRPFKARVTESFASAADDGGPGPSPDETPCIQMDVQGPETARRQEFSLEMQTPGTGMGKLIDMYLDFVALVDHLPSWLQSPHGAVRSVASNVAEYQVICFWAQRSNIMSVYHCMRMLILQKCIEGSMPEVVGLNDQPVSWAMQKLDIARDFLNELQMAPFACFKAQGESAVERVRRVGGILLAIVNGAPNSSIETRARHQFEQLLDILANLDSRATDGLQAPEFPNFTDFCQ